MLIKATIHAAAVVTCNKTDPGGFSRKMEGQLSSRYNAHCIYYFLNMYTICTQTNEPEKVLFMKICIFRTFFVIGEIVDIFTL